MIDKMSSAADCGKPKGLVIAGVSSGVGKTSLSLGLMAALKRRGHTVQSFKVGPDFIDPGHHTAITGRPSHNLDGWMMAEDENRAIFNRYAPSADVVVVEGVMGLYDGYDGKTEAGSTAQMAKWLNLPVLLCVDARSMARSMAAIALGFANFDPGLTWAGLIANRVGSDRHLAYLREAMADVPDIPLMGGMLRRPEITLPERHLGLVTAEETPWDDESVTRLADWVEEGLDISALLDRLPIHSFDPPLDDTPETGSGRRVRIGVAKDAAFCFYYPENFRRLEEAGAELVMFSPLAGDPLPDNLDGLYFGGGYPEVFAERISRNESLLRAVREFGEAGRPVYAECGGLMFLSKGIRDADGNFWPMTGLLPLKVGMLPRLRSLGYREVEFTRPTILGPNGTVCRGHEFHYSEILEAEPVDTAYRVSGRRLTGDTAAGYTKSNVLASYVHLHFGSEPELAYSLVRKCREYGE